MFPKVKCNVTSNLIANFSLDLSKNARNKFGGAGGVVGQVCTHSLHILHLPVQRSKDVGNRML